MDRSKQIMIVSDNVGADYVARIEAGVRRSTYATNVPILSENLHQSERTLDQLLEDGPYAGIILTAPLCDDRHSLLKIERTDTPYARVASMLDLDRGLNVLLDEYEAARAVTEAILSKGHQRVGILKGPRQHLVSMRRYNGFVNAMAARQLAIDPALVAEGDFSRESGYAQAGRLFAAKPTAIFACNDDMAAGLIDAAKEDGIDVPHALSIAGYDDNAVAREVRPRLTSVRQPLEKMGETAIELLTEKIRQPSSPNRNVTLQLEVVERESVAEPPPAS